MEDKIESRSEIFCALRGLIYTVGIVLLCAVIYLFFCLAADIFIDRISYSAKLKIESLFPFGIKADCLQSSEKLNKILQEISSYDKRIENVYACVIRGDELRAFMNVRGQIFVYEGLFKKLSKQQMTFVLAHEAGHYINRDTLKKIVRNILTLSFAGDSSMSEFLSLSYSRKQEEMADEYASKVLFKMFGNNNAAYEFFEIINAAMPDGDMASEYFSTHPLNTKRINKLKIRFLRYS
ncbi:MAG: M56 family metallopeptidase [Endomicrobium sp.]|jgi:predicted Zn-dependent protease|nr:M56 family metallopeptidase [Endomicrobium sp.]